MPLPAVLHPDVVDFLRTHTQNDLKDKVWKCIEKLRYQEFDSGLRVKKLKGMPKRVWEARISQASRLIFTYDSSRQPDTGDARVYIAVQDVCLEHDDVSRRVKARKRTPDAQWLDAEEIEVIGSLERDVSLLNSTEKNALLTLQVEDSQISDYFVDELLSNIQRQVVDSGSEWQRAIIEKDADLRLKLTPEEYQLVKEPGNLLLSGSAGTGKTTVGLYRLLENLDNLPIQKRLYIAYNPILVKDSQKEFKRLIGINNSELNSSFHFKTIRELCLEILNEVGLSYLEYDEVDYKVFEQLYYCRECKQYPPALVWSEIRSLIKGSQLATDIKLLSKHEYERLGKKRALIIPYNERYNLYKLAKWYQEKLKSNGYFDEIDLSRQALKFIKQGKGERYQLIVCDEVQDFTELQLELLMQLVTPEGHIFFAGDLNQMISPSGFRWEDLKSKFFKSKRQAVHKTLKFNFRSISSLVNLANQVLKLGSRLLCERLDESHPQKSSTKRSIYLKSLLNKKNKQKIYVTFWEYHGDQH